MAFVESLSSADFPEGAELIPIRDDCDCHREESGNQGCDEGAFLVIRAATMVGLGGIAAREMPGRKLQAIVSKAIESAKARANFLEWAAGSCHLPCQQQYHSEYRQCGERSTPFVDRPLISAKQKRR
jgi:hypothetical protein